MTGFYTFFLNDKMDVSPVCIAVLCYCSSPYFLFTVIFLCLTDKHRPFHPLFPHATHAHTHTCA
uniref:Uncharacterized protein n=1 Tax=Anguilla anguilla TaxID=7936 RepID=A0A0E9W1F4_ANGAN